MIKLKVAANFGGELHQSGAVVNLPPQIENRMIENGLATRDIVSVDDIKSDINGLKGMGVEISEDTMTPMSGSPAKSKAPVETPTEAPAEIKKPTKRGGKK